MQQLLYSLEVSATEFIANHAWHYLRPLVTRHLKPRCAQCILSAAYMPLNAAGICPICVEYNALPKLHQADKIKTGSATQQTELNEILQNAIGKGTGAYDAVMLLSGGKDSAYMLHRITQEYPKLRLVCVLVDNGFMSPFALQNAKQLIAHFKIPYVVLHPETTCVRSVFRYALTHLHLQREYSIVDWMDGLITFDHGRHYATAQGAPLILCGLSKVQLSFVFGVPGIEITQAQERAPLEQGCGISIKTLELPQRINQDFWFDATSLPQEKIPRLISPIAAWDLDETEILTTLNQLKLLDQRKSRPLMTNNALIPVIALAEAARFGYCCWEVEFARMVREGKSERNYWLALFEMLEYSAKTGRFINRNVDRTLSQLGLTRTDIGIHV